MSYNGIIEFTMSLSSEYAPEIKSPQNNFTYVWGWINTMVLFEGLKRAGKDLSREGLVDALETLNNFETGGLRGPISFGPQNRHGGGDGRILKIDLKKQTFVPLTGWRKPSIR